MMRCFEVRSKLKKNRRVFYFGGATETLRVVERKVIIHNFISYNWTITFAEMLFLTWKFEGFH